MCSSDLAHLNFLVLLLRPFFPSGTRVLVRQNGTVSAALAFGDLPSYTRLLYRLLYRRADRVICQSQAMADDLAREAWVAAVRLTVCPIRLMWTESARECLRTRNAGSVLARIFWPSADWLQLKDSTCFCEHLQECTGDSQPPIC